MLYNYLAEMYESGMFNEIKILCDMYVNVSD